MNFQINEKSIENHCDNGKSKCCMLCKYVSDDINGEWKACTDSCIVHKDIIQFSCTQCKHKPEYIK